MKWWSDDQGFIEWMITDYRQNQVCLYCRLGEVENCQPLLLPQALKTHHKREGEWKEGGHRKQNKTRKPKSKKIQQNPDPDIIWFIHGGDSFLTI